LLFKVVHALNVTTDTAKLILLPVRIALTSLLLRLIASQSGPDTGDGVRPCGRHPLNSQPVSLLATFSFIAELPNLHPCWVFLFAVVGALGMALITTTVANDIMASSAFAITLAFIQVAQAAGTWRYSEKILVD